MLSMPTGDSPSVSSHADCAGATRRSVARLLPLTYSPMGLDMYAARKTNVKRWECQPPEERYEVQVTRGGKPVEHIRPERISHVVEDVMYWRKANQIHAWFVENVQGGDDDCADYCVSWERLEELLKVCEKVIKASKLVKGEVKNGERYDSETKSWEPITQPGKVIKDPTVAKELLPTNDGFFFGSQEYDEFYLEDVVRTRDWLLQEFDDRSKWEVPTCIHYSSSW